MCRRTVRAGSGRRLAEVRSRVALSAIYFLEGLSNRVIWMTVVLFLFVNSRVRGSYDVPERCVQSSIGHVRRFRLMIVNVGSGGRSVIEMNRSE